MGALAGAGAFVEGVQVLFYLKFFHPSKSPDGGLDNDNNGRSR